MGIQNEAAVALGSRHAAAIVVVAEPIQLRRIRNGQRFQHHGVQEGEDGGVRANAQGQSEHNNNAETRRFAEGTNTEADVAPDSFYNRFPSGSIHNLLRHFDTASLQAHSANGSGAGHSLSHLFLSSHLHEAV